MGERGEGKVKLICEMPSCELLLNKYNEQGGI